MNHHENQRQDNLGDSMANAVLCTVDDPKNESEQSEKAGEAKKGEDAEDIAGSYHS
mgnify:CR=1 FL=1